MAEITPGLLQYPLYPKKYFSGTNTYIAFNNVPVSEIISINWQLQQNGQPIYGYASYTFDAIANGARLVTGSFRVNFVESQYIRSVLTKLSKAGINSSTPETIRTSMTSDELKAWMNGKDLFDIKSIANEYEAGVWGVDGAWQTNKYEDTFFTSKNSLLTKHGFDIIVSYGDELLELGKTIDDMPGTVKVINGVHLTGISQIVQPTGEAIFEEYTFIAKDLDNTLIKK